MAAEKILGELNENEASTDEEEAIANFGVACRECQEAFPSGNQLHDHLKTFNAHAVEEVASVLDLTAKQKIEQSEDISNSTETLVKAYRNVEDPTESFTAVIDSGFGHSAVNRKFLNDVPHTFKSIIPLIIRGIDGRKTVSELATFVLYLRSNQGVFLKLKIAALIFDDLGTNLLISIDYIKAWDLVLDIPRQFGIFHRSDKVRKPMAVVCLQVTRQSIISLVI